MHRTNVLCFVGSADGSRRTVGTDFFAYRKRSDTMGMYYDYTHSVHCSQTKNANLIRHIALFSYFCYDLGNKKISLVPASEI